MWWAPDQPGTRFACGVHEGCAHQDVRKVLVHCLLAFLFFIVLANASIDRSRNNVGVDDIRLVFSGLDTSPDLSIALAVRGQPVTHHAIFRAHLHHLLPLARTQSPKIRLLAHCELLSATRVDGRAPPSRFV